MAAPSITLPKGGGAIRGLGEKFAVNPATGTGSLSVPIATSPGRSGFGPQLSLAYDSAAGNGPFGFGWHLSLPSITRKTDKGLPRYDDAGESDVYLLSGAEDLVPVLQADLTRFSDTATAPGFVIHRYRPRVEGLFARIERWTRMATGEIHWRSISRENVTTLYGRDGHSRISDPAEPRRVFAWLIRASWDDKGNAILYDYAAENDANVDQSRSNERNRTRTAQRYIKRIRYGNRTPNRDLATWAPTDPALLDDWMFEVVFDYAEGHYEIVNADPAADEHPLIRATAVPARAWPARPDPFSSYRAGFEVRTYRRCHRILMFHHIPALETDEAGYDGLVRSTDLHYSDLDDAQNVTIEDELTYQGSTRFASFVTAITQSGYVRVADTTYLKKSLPPLQFEYSKARIRDQVLEPDAESLENLPAGLDAATYRWVDLDGEGISGILTEQAQAWLYKPNLGDGRFGPLQRIPAIPSLAALSGGSQQLLDLAGDGQMDLVSFQEPTPGFYERTFDRQWAPFRPFRQLPVVAWDDPNLRFIDLDGDGHADILITEQNVFTWYPSLGEEGFGGARRAFKAIEEERGPRLVLADGTQSIYLADMGGDGLTDLVRIRNGEVCYWPNLGHGRFGAKVTMDHAPRFDTTDHFDQRRVRLADIDGSGASDIIYLRADGIFAYFNQSGNRLSEARRLADFPHVDNLSSIMTVDFLGNGTTCLVWSSPLPGHTRRALRYIDLMGGIKPHLLIRSINNLGAETEIQYVASTHFYLADKRVGKPWVTRLPIPVHVVEGVITRDRVSGNIFTSTYTYHHGYFDGIEREFRGFGMLEQQDTEEFAMINAEVALPPVLTRTWFHTGVYDEIDEVSQHFAADYYGAPERDDPAFAAFLLTLLPDTVMPPSLTVEEEREASRALRGSMLRQEVYALDGTASQPHPYTVTERNFTIRPLQPRGGNRNAVFFTHPRESITYHYERDSADPRIGHSLTLETDRFGNVLQSASIGYGRQVADGTLSAADQTRQAEAHITYTVGAVTRDQDTASDAIDRPNDYRTPLPAESRTFHITGLPVPAGTRLSFQEVLDAATNAVPRDYELDPTPGLLERRLIEHVRTYYRRDDLAGPLPLARVQSMALPYESYKLAFTPGLVAQIYGGRVTNDMLEGAGAVPGGRYVHTEADPNWWVPSGRMFFSPSPAHNDAQELAFARRHFFLPHRYRDPFHTVAASTETIATYDGYDLLLHETTDAAGSRVTVGERAGPALPATRRNDYRVLQPALVMEPNRNCVEARFDALGFVAGMAVMGKPEDNPRPGDRFTAAFRADLTLDDVAQFLANPTGPIAAALLAEATTRTVYDLDAYVRDGRPAVAASLARETHASDPVPAGGLRMQTVLTYSDGFAREVQKKMRAEGGPVPVRDAEGKIALGADGQPQMTPNDVAPRWVGSGWTVFNNKGKPVRRYEPFFTDTHRYEREARIGVSPITFYDPVGRVVATMHPNHAWEKVVFNAWRQETWDVNDTVLIPDPKNDPNVGVLLSRAPDADVFPTWDSLRTNAANAAAFAARYPDAADRLHQTRAADKTRFHAATPLVLHLDSQRRAIVAVRHNRLKYTNTPAADPPVNEFQTTRMLYDIEGNQREVIDPLNRSVVRYGYDMLGNRIRQSNMEAGQRWILNDVAGQPLYTWDSRGHQIRTAYDPLRRPTATLLAGGAGGEIMVGRITYGESVPNPENANLRGRAVEHRDQSGVLATDAYDFKGNLVRSRRRLAEVVDPAGANQRAYRTTVDWNLAVTLSAETYTSHTRHDALSRPTQLVAPHSDQAGAHVYVLQPVYNEAGLLERLHAWLDGNADPADLLNPATATMDAVTDIDYDAKAQRLRIGYGNGAITLFTYDPLTFRLARLLTRRNAGDFPDDCPEAPPEGWPGCNVQNVRYTYDPAGNITHTRDFAQQTVYFQNRRVEPSCDYLYDASYRLIEATGREHLGTAAAPPIPHFYNDLQRTRLQHRGDGNALGLFLERYAYDTAGNILTMQHVGTDPANAGWTRTYHYEEASLLEPGNPSNRLTRTVIGATVEEYSAAGNGYDAHGNMLRMPHLQVMQWDFRDQLQMTRRQAVNAGDADGVLHQGERTWYVYDFAGRRVRKVTESAAGQITNEHLYLGGVEIHRRHGINPVVRETLHIMGEKERIALVETRTSGVDPGSPRLIRYQLSNHLGSTGLELDDHAQIISYEEYSPYGSTVYQAVASQTETPKRYRYTGKERDEESGFYYHGARYYAPWLGRWTRCDPFVLTTQASKAEGDLARSDHPSTPRMGERKTADPKPSQTPAPDYADSSQTPPEPMAKNEPGDEELNLYAYVGNSPITYRDLRGELRDDPQDRASARTYGVLQAAELAGLPILETIEGSPTLRPVDVERAARNGTLTNFDRHPGSTFLGAVGEALVLHNIRSQSGGVFGSISSFAVSQPGSAQLPDWARQVIGNTLPDILATQIGGTTRVLGLRFEQRVVWRNTIGPGTGGRVDSVDHGTNTVVSLMEVTVSTRYDRILERAQRVATWATALQRVRTGSVRAAAVLVIDRGAFFQLSETERTTVVNTVTRAGGYISLQRDLTSTSIRNARTLASEIRGP